MNALAEKELLHKAKRARLSLTRMKTLQLPSRLFRKGLNYQHQAYCLYGNIIGVVMTPEALILFSLTSVTHELNPGQLRVWPWLTLYTEFI